MEQRPLVNPMFTSAEIAEPRLELLPAVDDPAALDDVDAVEVDEVEEAGEVEIDDVESDADADPDEVHISCRRLSPRIRSSSTFARSRAARS